jgi:hypothetical protein
MDDNNNKIPGKRASDTSQGGDYSSYPEYARQPKKVTRERLTREGNLGAFNEKREMLIGLGIPAGEAWVAAAESFPPVSPENLPPLPKGKVRPEDGLVLFGDRVDKEVFGDRDCPSHVAVKWVADNVVLKEVSAKDAPSPMAYGMLRWAQRTPSNESCFWKDLSTRIFPSRADLDSQLRFSDKGDQVIRAIEELEKMSSESGE